MPPTAAPPNFYDNVAAMGGGQKPPSPDAGGAGAPGAAGSDDELMTAFAGVFRVMKKMEKLKPELVERFAPIRQQFKEAIVDVLKKDPKAVDDDAGPSDTVQGNKSPQDVPPAPQPVADAEKVPA